MSNYYKVDLRNKILLILPTSILFESETILTVVKSSNGEFYHLKKDAKYHPLFNNLSDAKEWAIKATREHIKRIEECIVGKQKAIKYIESHPNKGKSIILDLSIKQSNEKIKEYEKQKIESLSEIEVLKGITNDSQLSLF